MNFSELRLDPLIQKALTACSYQKPTEIQAAAIPPILEGQDVAASAATGSGKTAAFVLPALHRLQEAGNAKTSRVLILTPTRELAKQITGAARLYGKLLKFKMVCLVGGESYYPQIKELERGADIIVATPGRLLDHVRSKRVNLSNIEMLILDEADRMLDMGFSEDVETIANLTPATRQTLLFSATLDKSITQVVKRLMKSPLHVDLANKSKSSPKIKQRVLRVKRSSDKMHLLQKCIEEDNIFKGIVFSGTKVNADRVSEELCASGIAAASLHGDLRQSTRNKTLEQLRRGKIQLLVATDVAARGIDIDDITHVINFDMPRTTEDYVHRIGRTGRAGREGKAISFVTTADAHMLRRIEKYLGINLKVEGEADTGKGGQSSYTKRDFSRRDRVSYDSPRKYSKTDRARSSKERPFRDKPFEDRNHKRFEDRSDDQKRLFREKSFEGQRNKRFDDRDDHKHDDRTALRRSTDYPKKGRFHDDRTSERRYDHDHRDFGGAKPKHKKEFVKKSYESNQSKDYTKPEKWTRSPRAKTNDYIPEGKPRKSDAESRSKVNVTHKASSYKDGASSSYKDGGKKKNTGYKGKSASSSRSKPKSYGKDYTQARKPQRSKSLSRAGRAG